jgi:hypothetical protein
MDSKVDQAIVVLTDQVGCSADSARDWLAKVSGQLGKNMDDTADYVMEHMRRAREWRQSRGYDR